MSDLLQLMVSEGAADLHLRVGIPPAFRSHGTIERVQGPDLTPEDTEELANSICSEDHMHQVKTKGGADFVVAASTRSNSPSRIALTSGGQSGKVSSITARASLALPSRARNRARAMCAIGSSGSIASAS